MSLPFRPVILWTDALLFVLLAAVAALAFWTARNPQWRRPWARVGSSPVAVACLVVLGAYALIAVLDSLHYRPRLPQAVPGQPAQYSDTVRSVFDALTPNLWRVQEETYSAPLAEHLFVRQPQTLPDGQVVRVYPRLRITAGFGPGQRWRDIARRALSGAAAGLAAGALCAGFLAWRCGRLRGARAWLIAAARGQVGWPARTLVATLTLVFALVGAIAALAPAYHVLGTDKVGQDVLYLTLKSIRTGLLIGTLTTLVTLPLAILLGIAAGYFGGWVDDVIQYVYTVLNSIPAVLLIAAAVLMAQVYIETHVRMFDTNAARADFRLLFLCLILGMTSWTTLARLLRGETLKIRALEYIEAARAFGVSHGRILLRHVLPNVFHIVLISTVMDFSGLVLAEAVLSYVGVGVDPLTYSWGNMINAARLELAREPVVWWQLVAAFVFMSMLVLAANLLADVVREAFDPRRGGA